MEIFDKSLHAGEVIGTKYRKSGLLSNLGDGWEGCGLWVEGDMPELGPVFSRQPERIGSFSGL